MGFPKGKPNLGARRWHARVKAGLVKTRTGMHGHVYTRKQRRNIKNALKGRWSNPEYQKAWHKTRDSRKHITRRSYVETWKRPEVKAARLPGLRKGRRTNRNTFIERRTAEVLIRLGVKFVHQPYLPNLSIIPDFYLPKYNRVIECDGSYWHGREHNKRNDRRKNAIYRRKGYKVSRWSEKFIKRESFEKFIVRLLDL